MQLGKVLIIEHKYEDLDKNQIINYNIDHIAEGDLDFKFVKQSKINEENQKFLMFKLRELQKHSFLIDKGRMNLMMKRLEELVDEKLDMLL